MKCLRKLNVKIMSYNFICLGLTVLTSCAFDVNNQDTDSMNKVGAKVSFITLEAESSVNNCKGKTVIMTEPLALTPESEASNYGFVELRQAGDYVEFANVSTANTLVVRHCIPDASEGGGITATLGLYVNGERRQNIQLSSKNNWLYGKNNAPHSNGQSNKPTPYPHVFWDETKFFIKGGVKKGDTIRLQKDSQDTAAYYRIDLIDLEMVPPPLPQPTDSLSVADYGAQGKNVNADMRAFTTCIKDAKALGKTVWIPTGTYLQNSTLNLDGVKVQGAGMWYTQIRFTADPKRWTGFFRLSGTGARVADLSLEGSLTARNAPLHGFIGGGRNWGVSNVWIMHSNTGFWIGGENGLVSYCRVRFTYADGININNGKVGAVKNIIVENNHVRGTGDDSIAILSQIHKKDKLSTDNVTIRHNTVIVPWWASCCDLAGGNGHRIENNYLTGHGLVINLPGAYPMLPQGKAVIRGNVIWRSGSCYNTQKRGALWIYAGSTTINDVVVENNRILNPLFHGIDITGKHEQNIIFRNNLIKNSGGEPVRIRRDAHGSGVFQDNSMSSTAGNCQHWYANDSQKGAFKIIQQNNNWTGTEKTGK